MEEEFPCRTRCSGSSLPSRVLQGVSAPNRKQQIACDFKSQDFPQIDVKKGPDRNPESRDCDLKFHLFANPAESQRRGLQR